MLDSKNIIQGALVSLDMVEVNPILSTNEKDVEATVEMGKYYIFICC